ncbi:LysR substrate-binding domain-containing protein [Mordavella massiliensis]|uniref:LysR family transcriptional regulator n=1 Tax=Mordavella massiliensis TaxID=1871024 RepID=A0A938XBD2_9CLOT|nr:LysR family transcriptional regulator [Mordavella massiliensis]
MDIKSLKYFLAVVQEGNISRAARKLCIAQPPLSRQIRLLEEELGTTLFIRGKKEIQLTQEGRFLKQQAGEILELLEKTQEQIGKFGSGVHGLVSIAAAESFGIGLLSDMVEEFHGLYPDVRFQIWCGNSDEVRDKLERGLADVGIVRAPVYMEQCEQIFLRSEPWVAAMSREHPLAQEQGEGITLKKLGGETLMLPVRDQLQEEINHWFNELAQEREILCYYNSSASMLPLVEKGMGIAICPGSARYFAAGEGIVYKTITEPRKESRLYMVRQRYRILSRAAGAFWEYASGQEKGGGQG